MLEGWRTLLQTAGVGVLSPNTAVLNFKTAGCDAGETKSGKQSATVSYAGYVQLLLDARELNFSFVLLKGYAHTQAKQDRETLPPTEMPPLREGFITAQLACDLRRAGLEPGRGFDALKSTEHLEVAPAVQASADAGKAGASSGASDLPPPSPKSKPEVMSLRKGCGAGTMARLPGIFKKHFSSSQSREGRIDVYWLCDNGGLTVLLPHLLKKNPVWANMTIRVLVPLHMPKDTKADPDAQLEALESVLKKLRLFSSQKVMARCCDLDGCFDSSKIDEVYANLESSSSLGSKAFTPPKNQETKVPC